MSLNLRRVRGSGSVCIEARWYMAHFEKRPLKVYQLTLSSAEKRSSSLCEMRRERANKLSLNIYGKYVWQRPYIEISSSQAKKAPHIIDWWRCGDGVGATEGNQNIRGMHHNVIIYQEIVILHIMRNQWPLYQATMMSYIDNGCSIPNHMISLKHWLWNVAKIAPHEKYDILMTVGEEKLSKRKSRSSLNPAENDIIIRISISHPSSALALRIISRRDVLARISWCRAREPVNHRCSLIEKLITSQ